MPTYVYKFVDTGETIEIQQGFHEDNLTEVAHPETGEIKPVKKVFTPVGVTFKGSGFFKTDNRGKKSPTATSTDSKSGSGTSESKSSDSKSDTKSDSKSATNASSTSTSKAETKSSSSASSSSSSTST